jgi:hypothetical protein
LWQRAAVILYALRFTGIVTEFQAAEAYSGLNPYKAKYSISRLSKVEKENFIELALIISVHVKKENRHDDGNDVCDQYAHPNP